MLYLLLGIIVVGIIAAILGYFRNKKWQRMLERGEIDAIPEVRNVPEGCCGQHEVCELDRLKAVVNKKISYYDDEELDLFQGMESWAYDESVVDAFREVLYTLRGNEVVGWLRSLELRRINLPDSLKDEAFLIIGEQQIQA